MALSDEDNEICAPSISDATFQQAQIIVAQGGEDSERIKLRTVDSYAKSHAIKDIHILKTDTEGFDLQVLAGAEQMLQRRNISYVLAEATLTKDDPDHTQLSGLQALLEMHSFRLHGLYDLHYDAFDGNLEYFNALFELQ